MYLSFLIMESKCMIYKTVERIEMECKQILDNILLPRKKFIS